MKYDHVLALVTQHLEQHVCVIFRYIIDEVYFEKKNILMATNTEQHFLTTKFGSFFSAISISSRINIFFRGNRIKFKADSIPKLKAIRNITNRFYGLCNVTVLSHQ